MRVICKANTGRYLRKFEKPNLAKKIFGRFGTSYHSEFNELDIGKEYIVMGMIAYPHSLKYLVGLEASGKNITTFHIKEAIKLSKEVPWINY